MSAWQIPGYEPIRELGAGASGVVVLARHEGTGRLVAIKYLADEFRADPDSLAAFRSEARLLSGLDSPHIARLYEYVECDLGAGIVQELVDGVSLRAMLREQGPIEPEAALAVLKGSLLGLAAAHRLDVVHRDFKPENVLIDGSGQSKLVDFGISVATGTALDQVAGTPSYMAPECWSDGPPTPAGDIYAATATFFECLVGHPPFTAGDRAALRLQHANAPIPADDVAAPLRNIVRRGLAKDPGRRPADATAFAAELEKTAEAAYGADWEEKGRHHLARRAALLSLLWPLATGIAATAVASTVLGLSKRRLLVGAAAILGVLGVGIAAAAQNPGHESSADPPTVTTTLTAVATTDPGTRANPPPPVHTSARHTRSSSRTATSSPTVTHASDAPTVVRTTPAHSSSTTLTSSAPSTSSGAPSAPVQVVKVTIESFAPVDADTPKSIVKVTVGTNTTDAVTVLLNYSQSKTGEIWEEHGSGVQHLSGALTYSFTEINTFTACPLWVVKVVSTPVADNGTQSSSTAGPAAC